MGRREGGGRYWDFKCQATYTLELEFLDSWDGSQARTWKSFFCHTCWGGGGMARRAEVYSGIINGAVPARSSSYPWKSVTDHKRALTSLFRSQGSGDGEMTRRAGGIGIINASVLTRSSSHGCKPARGVPNPRPFRHAFRRFATDTAPRTHTHPPPPIPYNQFHVFLHEQKPT